MKFEETILAAITGFVDTLSFVALFGVFSPHVTGDSVFNGAGIVGSEKVVLIQLIVFPAFFGGVIVSSLLVRSLSEERARHGARLLHALQAALMIGFCFAA